MLDCKACMSRCIRTIFADGLGGPSQPQFYHRSNQGLRNGRHPVSILRGYHSAIRTTEGLYRDRDKKSRNYVAPRRQTTQALPQTEDFSGLPPTSLSRHNEGKKIEPRSLAPQTSPDLAGSSKKAFDLRRKKHLDRELVWLQDPLKLAENTIGLLRDNDDEKAIEIVRMASKKAPCTVSWNHLIDYEMSKGRVQKAVKIYHEVGGSRLESPVHAHFS